MSAAREETMTMPRKIAYVQAAWHTDITDRCKQAFTDELARHGYDVAGLEFFSAPGSLEIPLMAKKLAKTGRYAAVCASGFVVDGGIYRHEFVANAVLQGIVQTSLETEVPVLSAVLTPHHFHEHAVHQEFFRAHMETKGQELARACLAIIDNLAAVA
jgi:6,7-dimethyl-8-ribityllumazine synthase